MYYLSKNGFDIVGNINFAMRKDGGLDPATLSYIVSTIKINETPDFLLKEVSIDDINCFLTKLKDDLAELAFPT